MAYTEQSVAGRALPPLESDVIRDIVPARRRLRLAHVPGSLPVIAVLAARDFKAKYKQSVLGPLWLVIQPLALFAGFLVAFRGRSSVGGGIPYVVFSLSGLAVWSFFQAALMIGTASLITNYSLLRFTPCPRLAFPVAALIASLPAVVVPGIAAVVAAALSGTLSVRALLLPLGYVWLFVFTMGVVGLSSSLAVRFRDISNVLPFALMLSLFIAPVGYPLAGLSHSLRTVIYLNPLTGVLEACRWLTISNYHPSVLAICLSLATTAAVLTLGWRVFTRLETTFADEI